MEITKNFDLIIGTGAAASTIAYKCNAIGWKVAVVDSRPFGGTCALRGCDPKKVLVGSADLIDANHRMKDKGLHHSGTNTAIALPVLPSDQFLDLEYFTTVLY